MFSTSPTPPQNAAEQSKKHDLIQFTNTLLNTKAATFR